MLVWWAGGAATLGFVSTVQAVIDGVTPARVTDARAVVTLHLVLGARCGKILFLV